MRADHHGITGFIGRVPGSIGARRLAAGGRQRQGWRAGAIGLCAALALGLAASPVWAQTQMTLTVEQLAQVEELNDIHVPYVSGVLGDQTSQNIEDRVLAALKGRGTAQDLETRGGIQGVRGISVWFGGYQSALKVDIDETPEREGAETDGDVTGGFLGVDTLADKLLLGAVISFGEASLDADQTTGTEGNAGKMAQHETSINGFHPYVAYQHSERSHIWGSIGFGSGDVDIKLDDSPMLDYSRDANLQTAAFGGYVRLSLNERTGGGKTEVGFVGNTNYSRLEVDTEEESGEGSRGASANIGRVRLGVELEHNSPLANGASFGMSGEVALREDFGTYALTGGGVEVGGGLSLAMPQSGLYFDLKTRLLAGHSDTEAQTLEEWGVAGGLSWIVNLDGRGLSVSFRPEYGSSAGFDGALWDKGFAALGARNGRAERPGMRHSLKVEYGIPTQQGQGLVRLYAVNRAAEGGSRQALGAAYGFGRHFSAGLETGLGARQALPVRLRRQGSAAADSMAPTGALDLDAAGQAHYGGAYNAYIRYQRGF